MYTRPAFPTKKALKEAVKQGDVISVYNYSMPSFVTLNGTDVIEGPEYPKPHRWYAQVKVVDGLVIEVTG